MERVERVADLVRDSSGKQRESVEAFRFESLLGGTAALGDVAQDNRVADLSRGDIDPIPLRTVGLIAAATRFDHQWDNVEVYEPVLWIKNFDVAANRDVSFGKRVPI